MVFYTGIYDVIDQPLVLFREKQKSTKCSEIFALLQIVIYSHFTVSGAMQPKQHKHQEFISIVFHIDGIDLILRRLK